VFNHLLVPLDGSEYSQRALATATDLARVTGARITLLGVIWRPQAPGVPHVEKLDDQSRKRVHDYLETLAAPVRKAGVAQVDAEVRFGQPADEIAHVAADAGVDLILMSTHGLGASGRYALGSVALKVLMSAPAPVLMVRIPEQTGMPQEVAVATARR